ncbi:DUF397 domain-containing protein [Streptomyces sp. 7N604]|uniref:DUF397 domain-containing protein n=1 Tax=Streptomyces sp. 7N604 TaxID=3457415 RepID=UPI003FD01654
MSTELAWFKSSYSDSEGGECIEVAVSWRKSSYSDSEGGACVEVAACPGTIHVRDSKDKTGPQLAFTSAAWAEFIAYAARQEAVPG